MTGKNKYTLPNHIIPFKNPDKEFQESVTEDLLFMPHSSRVLFYGGPSTGKTTAILNTILHQNFDRIIVVHNDMNTKEYENIDCEYYDEVPKVPELNLDPTMKKFDNFRRFIFCQNNNENG